MVEIWKDVVGYEGLYLVYNHGNIRGLKGLLSNWIDRDGYRRVSLNKNGHKKNFGIHKLVAIAFITNVEKLPCINHIDEDKLNNNHYNLEWCTVKYNNNYNGAMFKRALKAATKRRKPVIGSLNGKDLIFEDSAKQCSKHGFNPSNITQCCKGNATRHKGYVWRYAND